MAATVVTSGDTIRLKATFYDWDGVLADPTAITVTFYDSSKTAIGTAVTLTLETAKISTGVYFYDYTVPSGYTKMYYEFNGTVDGDPSIERGELRVTWL